MKEKQEAQTHTHTNRQKTPPKTTTLHSFIHSFKQLCQGLTLTLMVKLLNNLMLQRLMKKISFENVISMFKNTKSVY